MALQLTRYVVWAREHLAPRAAWPDRSTAGAPPATGMAHVMKIVVESAMHLVMNAAATHPACVIGTGRMGTVMVEWLAGADVSLQRVWRS
ncbi:hypothetical protein GCM10022214_00300 [Actinomadura miaoliensis]|uniref:Pyrroline-5-carboxylate reductase catalytic N-terminal domain-containing protein n=2 Tax=Actinomadura miaoliensis TaxID=430685 RepID=A0ABP7UV41_9ACTN